MVIKKRALQSIYYPFACPPISFKNCTHTHSQAHQIRYNWQTVVLRCHPLRKMSKNLQLLYLTISWNVHGREKKWALLLYWIDSVAYFIRFEKWICLQTCKPAWTIWTRLQKRHWFQTQKKSWDFVLLRTEDGRDTFFYGQSSKNRFLIQDSFTSGQSPSLKPPALPKLWSNAQAKRKRL